MPTSVPGSSSADTRLVQQKLNSFPGSILPKLAEDGIFGPKTRARTIEFQKQRGLVPDGIVGVKTRAALGMSGAAPFTPPTAPGLVGSGTQAVDAVVSAFTAAFDSWKAAASFAGISVNAVTAVGRPGCLIGPPLLPLMAPRLLALGGDDRAIAAAAAQGISSNFAAWQNGVTVPGLPWYPTFAAFPGPVVPPTPNIPTPLLALVSAGLGGMTDANALQASMAAAASVSIRERAKPSFASIATVVAAQFQTKLLVTQVQGVLGTGPVPSFAPPYVPVGPVVGGTAFSPPGALQ
ncbi:MAG: peptidoglycan-binding domain-containing protein [Casimicrobiaceae bacterium]